MSTPTTEIWRSKNKPGTWCGQIIVGGEVAQFFRGPSYDDVESQIALGLIDMRKRKAR